MDRILESVLYLLKEKTRIGRNCVVSDKVWLRKTKKSRFVFLLWEKKIQNNEIKTPTLEDTIFKKKKKTVEKWEWENAANSCPRRAGVMTILLSSLETRYSSSCWMGW